ncbi:AAA family ATPase [Desulfuribacillus alkaliarsenatis]|uniref:Carbon monoxide dehydrogenase n=1 Tax=Desulfuribacillus alkaliarsenatis TaxID=766136 RepID=A0A1E5G4J6_9FIRM|nr:AAA family ATPase [Desulfuribacillus alkaliarsenatis]OEF98012.1 carbon monoxide dehydrogenase [Desulfuribacillus alkaliarsenatis]
MSKGLKLAVSGKGGVGKTTISSLICQILAREGKQVLAVDADPDANLGMALGFAPESLEKSITIAQDRKLIKEKTGAEPGSSGQWFALNPTVEDIPDRYVVSENGIKLLQMGAVSSGGGGCACPESTLLKTLLNHLIVDEQDAVIVDMEAGLEHLGRGTAQSVDALLIVIEQGQRSFTTAKTIVKLARDLGVTKVYGVANKIVNTTVEEIQQQIGKDLQIIGAIPYTPGAVTCDYKGENIIDACPTIVDEVRSVLEKIKANL